MWHVKGEEETHRMPMSRNNDAVGKSLLKSNNSPRKQLVSHTWETKAIFLSPKDQVKRILALDQVFGLTQTSWTRHATRFNATYVYNTCCHVSITLRTSTHLFPVLIFSISLVSCWKHFWFEYWRCSKPGRAQTAWTIGEQTNQPSQSHFCWHCIILGS